MAINKWEAQDIDKVERGPCSQFSTRKRFSETTIHRFTQHLTHHLLSVVSGWGICMLFLHEQECLVMLLRGGEYSQPIELTRQQVSLEIINISLNEIMSKKSVSLGACSRELTNSRHQQNCWRYSFMILYGLGFGG